MARDIIDPPPRERTALDENGRPENRTSGPQPVYGEPKGPLPPHFEILPKAEIEDRARGGAAPSAPTPAPKRDRDGFESGMRTPETFATTAGQHSGVQRRALDGSRLPEDDPSRDDGADDDRG